MIILIYFLFIWLNIIVWWNGRYSHQSVQVWEKPPLLTNPTTELVMNSLVIPFLGLGIFILITNWKVIVLTYIILVFLRILQKKTTTHVYEALEQIALIPIIGISKLWDKR